MEKTLIKKLVGILKNVERIPKDGTNSFHSYKYVTESAVTEYIRKELAQNNIFLFTSVEECLQVSDKITRVKVMFSFVDADTNERESIVCYGDGYDKLDKGIYKALTGATKYALMKTFLISTGDDPEDDDKRERRQYDSHQNEKVDDNNNISRLATTTEKKEIWNASRVIGKTKDQLQAEIRGKYGKTSGELTEDDVYNLLSEYIEIAQKQPKTKWMGRQYLELCRRGGVLPWGTALLIKKHYEIHDVNDPDREMRKYMETYDSFSSFVNNLYEQVAQNGT